MILLSESKYDDKRRFWLYERYKQWRYVRHFVAALVGGERHRDYLISLGMKPDKIVKGYDVVDNQAFAEIADAGAENDAAIVETYPSLPPAGCFVIATRMIPRKNLVRFISAYAHYSRGVENPIPVLLIGSGPDEKAVRERIADAELDALVTIIRFVEYRLMPHFFARAGALVHPALSEQWGLVVNEACAAGLPVLVSSTVGATDELVRDGVNGFVYDPTDGQAISRALTTFHHLTPEHRVEMGKASRELVANWGPDRFGNALKKILQDLVN